MRLSLLGPGHVLLQSPRGARRSAFAVASLAVAGSIAAVHNLGSSPATIVAVVAAVVLLAFATGWLLHHSELELRGDTLRWRRRGVFGDTDIEAPRSAVRHLRMRGQIVVQKSQHGQHRSMRYLVELIAEHPELPPLLPLLRHSREVAARRFAEAVAKGADLPLLDGIGDVPELRAPHALDAQPRTRAPLPAAVPAAIAVAPPDGLHGPQVLLQPPRRQLLLGVAGLGALAAMAAAFAGSLARPLPAPLLLALLLPFALVLLAVVATSRRRQRLFVQDRELHVVQQVLGLPLRHRRLPGTAIERLRIQTSTPAAPQLHRGLAVVSDHEVLVVGSELQADDLRWLSAWIEEQLWPQLPVRAAGEAARESAPPAATLRR